MLNCATGNQPPPNIVGGRQALDDTLNATGNLPLISRCSSAAKPPGSNRPPASGPSPCQLGSRQRRQSCEKYTETALVCRGVRGLDLISFERKIIQSNHFDFAIRPSDQFNFKITSHPIQSYSIYFDLDWIDFRFFIKKL